MTTTIQERSNEIKHLDEEKTTLLAQQYRLNTEIADSRTAIDEINQEIDGLSNKLDQARGLYTSTIDQYKQDLNKAKTERHDLVSENLLLKRKYDLLIAKAEIRLKELDARDDALAKSENDLTQRRRRLERD